VNPNHQAVKVNPLQVLNPKMKQTFSKPN